MRSDRLLLIGILLIGATLRFTGLDWSVDRSTGVLHKFHPDEATVLDNARWLGEDITRVKSAYGVIPVYLVYVVGNVSGTIFGFEPFDEGDERAMRLTYLTARAISAALGTMTILIAFLIGHRVGGVAIGGMGAALLALSPGHIQQCHFYTVDASITFWVTLALYLTLLTPTTRWWVHLLIGFSIGIAGGHRFVAVLLALPYLMANLWHPGDRSRHDFLLGLKERFKKLLTLPTILYGTIALIIVILSTPTLLIDPESFFSLGDQRNFLPSVDVATGKALRLWNLYDFTTTPYLFYLTDLFPAALGTIAAFAALVGLIALGLQPNRVMTILLAWGIPYFLMTGGLFTKPIRYTTPLLPLLCCLAAYACVVVAARFQRRGAPPVFAILTALVLIFTAAHGIAISRIYTEENVRFEANRLIRQSLPETTRVIGETGGFPTLWMASHFSESIKDPGSLFMRTRNHVLPSSVIDIVSETASAADYWILITQNRAIPYTSAPEQFPLAADLYTRLRAGRLGFERTARYTHPASIFGFEFDDEDTDPTISGFDRPTIEVYRRTSRHDSLREVWKHEVISDSRNPDKMILSGISVYRKGRFEAALKIFESAVQRYPDSKLAKLCEVEAMYKTAGADGAKQAFMDAIVSQWDFAGLTLAGIPERGAEYIRITQERKPKTAENLYLRQLASRAFIKLGYDSQNAGDTDRAIEWYENAIELDRKYLRPFRALGQLYLEKDQFEASRDAFSEAIKIRSHIDELWIGLAIAESRLGNVSAAYKAVRTAMEMAPGKALYHLVLIGLEEYFRSAGQDAWANEIRRYVDI